MSEKLEWSYNEKKHYIITYDYKGTLYLIDSYINDYYSITNDDVIKKIIKTKKISIDKLQKDFKKFEKSLIGEVYHIINYAHYLLNNFQELKKQYKEELVHFNKSKIKKLCITVLAFRLSTLNEQNTIIKNEKRRRKEGTQKKHNRKIDLATSRAIQLSNVLLNVTLSKEMPISEYKQHKSQSGGKDIIKLIDDIYTNGKYDNSHEWINSTLLMTNFMYATNAPLDYSSLESFVNNHKEIMELTSLVQK